MANPWQNILFGNPAIAYTEDQIQVFNLYLGNLPRSITKDNLRDYFSSYGDIKSVEIHSKRGTNNRFYKYGFVNFKDATSAGAVLESSKHSICNRKIRVRPADSWKQPIPGQDRDGDIDSIESKENDPSDSPILQLNDYCLLHVCSFLTLGEQINLSDTCMRFSGILDTIFRHKKVLSICEEPVTLMQLRKILVKAGHRIHQIKVNDTSCLQLPSRSLQFISQMCPNLRELRFSNSWGIYPTVFKDVGLKLKYLTKIELPNCNIHDDICHNLAHLENVEFIDFSNNCEITGKHIDKFPKLEYLNLSDCSNIQPYFFSSICERGILKWLNIKRCDRLNSYCFSKALPKLKHLEELSISSSYRQNGLNKISQLESLKTLTMYWPQDLNVDFFKQLVENKSEKLESLTLMGNCLGIEKLECVYNFKNLKKLIILKDQSVFDSFLKKLCTLNQLNYLSVAYCENITSDGLIKLFEEATNINELDITGCNGITDETIFEIAKRIKKRGNKSHCTIYAGCTEVSKDILEEKTYKEYTSFVSLSFKEFFLRSDIQLLDDSDSFFDDQLFDDLDFEDSLDDLTDFDSDLEDFEDLHDVLFYI